MENAGRERGNARRGTVVRRRREANMVRVPSDWPRAPRLPLLLPLLCFLLALPLSLCASGAEDELWQQLASTLLGGGRVTVASSLDALLGVRWLKAARIVPEPRNASAPYCAAVVSKACGAVLDSFQISPQRCDGEQGPPALHISLAAPLTAHTHTLSWRWAGTGLPDGSAESEEGVAALEWEVLEAALLKPFAPHAAALTARVYTVVDGKGTPQAYIILRSSGGVPVDLDAFAVVAPQRSLLHAVRARYNNG